MSTEINRVQSRKQVMTDVWVPVIDQIMFRDYANRGQESIYTYDNSDANTARVVSVVTVGDDLKVERIVRFKTKDVVRRGQEEIETRLKIDDQSSLRVVQYVRYCANNDRTSGSWVDVAQTLVLRTKDYVNRGQESKFFLTQWPDASSPISDGDPFNPTFAECDMSLPVADYSGTTIDPPWRLDPWTDIVNSQTGAVEFYPGIS